MGIYAQVRMVYGNFFRYRALSCEGVTGMLLISTSGLVEEDSIEVFLYYGVHSSFVMYNFKSFQGE